SSGEQPHRLVRGMDRPGDVLPGIQSDMSDHAGQEHVRWCLEPADTYRLAFQVTNRPDVRGAEQLEAADMDTGQDDERRAPVQASVPTVAKSLAMSASPDSNA